MRIGFLIIASLLLSGVPAMATTPSGGWQVTVKASPDRLLAHPGKIIQLLITVQDGQGQGVSGLPVKIDASRGKLGQVRDEGQGRYASTLKLPKQRHPQAILVAAKVPGAPPAWCTIRLLSEVNLPINTDKPRVQVTLKLGGRSYGPARTDHRGRVKIPVQVAPGEFEATAMALDEFGNRSLRKVKIPIPKSPSLVGFAERAQLAADGQDSTKIYLVAIKANGLADETRKFVASMKSGQVDPAKRIAPGIVTIRFTAPKGLRRKQIQLRLADKERPKLNQRSFSFKLGTGQPNKLSLNTNPKKLVADGKSAARFELRLEDRAGNPLPGHPITIQCAKGFTSPIRDRGDGQYEADFTAPLHQRGSAGCIASLAKADGTSLTAQAILDLMPPVPAKLIIQADKNSLPQDGVSHSLIEIRVLDKHDNPLEGVVVKASAPLGGLDPVSEDGQGRYHLTYTAPRGEEDTRVRIEVAAGSSKQPIRQNLFIPLQGVVPPRPPAPMFSLGPSAAFLTNFGRLHSGGITLDLAWQLPYLGGYLYLDLETGYRFGETSQTLSNDPRAADLTTTLENVPLHLSLLYKPWPRHPVTAIIGLGGGAEFIQWSLRSTDGAVERNHDVLLGALGLLGVEARWGPGAIFLHARYLYAFLRDEAPRAAEATSGSTIKGNVGGLDILFGYHLFF